jgi:hypothetical protein
MGVQMRKFVKAAGKYSADSQFKGMYNGVMASRGDI